MNTPSNNKIRIYDLARKLKKSNKELLAVLQQLDIPVKSHSSSIDEDTAQIVENILAEASASKSQEKNQHGSEPSKSPERAEKRESTDDKLPPERDIKPHDKHHNRDPHNPPQTPPSTKATVPVQPQPQPAKSQGGKKLVERPPIITVMGHVDHGKTTLLDNIRHSSIAAHEAGGITQHIGAYVVIQDGKQIVFLDTPGHEAFTEMRARGASVTDIVILVIGADDGVMPQTREAINHIKAAGVPLVVAINKIDKQGAKPDRVRQQLSELGIFTEGWGGEVGAVEISAKQGIGVPDLLERVLLEAEMQELKGNPDANPEGVVIEARLDKGKGPVATVIVKDGTLKSGDIVLFNSTWGKTRALFDWAGKGLKKAGPSTPVEILGLDGVPNPGETFKVVKTEREARDAIAAIRSAERDANAEIKKASFEDLYSNLEEGQLPHLNLVVKCDVQGSLEALCASLEKLATNEVGVSIVHRGVGRIAESDVMLASASNAVIVGFNVRPDGNAKRVADLNGVEIRIYSVIYDVMDDVKAAMAGLLKPVLREDTLGEVEVRKLFRVPKVGIIAGSHVTKGVVKRTAKVRVIRDGVVIWDGKIASLRHEKDEAKELRAGNDCGISLEGFQDFREGDILEVYEVIEEKRTL
ncbi:MAG: translation initiation factor IF-2 [Synergistaceae bacterium]|nr:translation initiation factor IF-2 [Synergistaceae bacterium]MBQ6418828.1 translation initiation factor IF-2 [Synergistaceae bacterium]